MAARCCPPPHVQIIRVGEIKAGIVGLERIVTSGTVVEARDDAQRRTALCAEARKQGNYITPSMEEEYAEAFLREYESYRRNHPVITKGE